MSTRAAVSPRRPATPPVAALAAWGLLLGGSASAAEVTIGGLWDITGPVASFLPPIIAANKLALSQVNGQGGLWSGDILTMEYADSKCDAKEASAAANKLVNIDNVVAIAGPLCSGAAIAAANTVTIDRGVVMITLGTSPAITTLDDKDLVFRTTPSDAFQGKILANVVKKRGIDKVAVTFIQNDYGKGMSDAFKAQFESLGGTVTAMSPHEGKKASYRSELAALKGKGATHLVVIAYSADSGPVILRQSLEGGYFDKFIGVGSLNDEAMMKQIGWPNLQGFIITEPGGVTESSGTGGFADALKAADPASAGKPFTANSYDAAFMLALALEKAGSADRSKVKAALREIAGPGGEVVLPGEWAKAKRLIKAGTKINYEGAAGPEDFDAAGDVAGVIDVYEVKGDKRVFVEKLSD